MRFNPIDIIALVVLLTIAYLGNITPMLVLIGLSILSISLSFIWIRFIKRGVVNINRDKYYNCSLMTLMLFGWWIGIDSINNYYKLPMDRFISDSEIDKEIESYERQKKINSIIE